MAVVDLFISPERTLTLCRTVSLPAVLEQMEAETLSLGLDPRVQS